MDLPNEQHSLSHVTQQASALSMRLDPPGPNLPPEEPPVNFRLYFNMVYDNRWLIGIITALLTVSALIYSLLAKPVYEANLMIHVEEESPNASKNILSEASSLFETKKAAIAEMELLRSRMVIARAVDNLQLYVEVQPVYFPIIGSWLADRSKGALSRPGMFGWGGYVWGGEKLEAGVFNVPDALIGREFLITALSGERYRFAGGSGTPAFEGQVGQQYVVPTADGTMQLKVTQIYAFAGAQFRLRRMARLGTIERIQNAMLITEQGKQSGVIEVKLQGENAKRINMLLSAIGREYLRQNLARKTEEAEKSLAFLNQQLPILEVT